MNFLYIDCDEYSNLRKGILNQHSHKCELINVWMKSQYFCHSEERSDEESHTTNTKFLLMLCGHRFFDKKRLRMTFFWLFVQALINENQPQISPISQMISQIKSEYICVICGLFFLLATLKFRYNKIHRDHRHAGQCSSNFKYPLNKLG